MEKIIDWLFFSENTFGWFEGNGFAFIFCGFAILLVISILASKKLRKIFF